MSTHAQPKATPRLAVHLETVAALLWPWFLVWTALGFFIMPWHVGEFEVHQWIANPGLAAALLKVLEAFDAIWIGLAAVNLYLYAAATEGLATARQWAIRIVGTVAVLGWVGAATGVPFGPFLYTGKLGFQIGHVLPLGVPLLWFTLILCSRYTVLSLFAKTGGRPRPNWQLALGTGALALLSDLNLEPVAWKVRFYWVWYPHEYTGPAWPPVQNFVSWFAGAFLLTLFLPAGRPAAAALHLKPVVALVLINALFLAVHLLG